MKRKCEIKNIADADDGSIAKEHRIEAMDSQFEKLPDELLAMIFSWFDFKTDNPLAYVCDSVKIRADWSKSLNEQNTVRLICKRFLAVHDENYKKKLEELLGCSYIKTEKEIRTYRQIYFDMENTIKYYAMSLYGQMLLWEEWDEKSADLDAYLNDDIYYWLIGNFLIDFAKDIKLFCILKYLFNNKLPKDPYNKNIFFKTLGVDDIIFNETTLLEWMSVIGDTESVEFLLSKGGRGRLEDDDLDNNPIYYALTGNMYGKNYCKIAKENSPKRIHIVNQLIATGGNIHANTDEGWEVSLFAQTLLHPECTEETIKLYLDRYFPEDDDVQFNPIQQIILILFQEKEMILQNKHYIFENCAKAFAYLCKQKFFSLWMKRFAEDVENLSEDTKYYQPIDDKDYYHSALDYLLAYQYKHDSFPNSNEFYEAILNLNAHALKL